MYLDFGPSDGSSLKASKVLLPSSRLFAIELNEPASASFDRLYSAKTFQSIDDLISSREMIKLAVFSHSLEHLSVNQLEDFSIKIKNILKPDGVLIVEVPNDDYLLREDRLADDAPHLVFWSKHSLRKFFERNGWKIIFIETVGGAVTEDSFKSYLEFISTSPKFDGSVFLNMFPRISFLLRRYMRTVNGLNFSQMEFNYAVHRGSLQAVLQRLS